MSVDAEQEAEERIRDAVQKVARRWPVLGRDDVEPFLVEAIMEAVEDMPAPVIAGWLGTAAPAARGES